MEIRNLTHSSRFEGVEALTQMRLFPEETVAFISRFSFNLKSVSFVLEEAPTEWGMMRGRDTVRRVKVRCIDPRVDFMHYSHCMMRIGRLTFDSSPDDAFVDLEGFAYIRCKKVIVKVETEKAVFPAKEISDTLLD